MTIEFPRSVGPVTESRAPKPPQPVKDVRGSEAVATAPAKATDQVAKLPPVEAGQVTPSDAEILAEDLQKLVQFVNRQLTFKVDDDTGRTVISVIDRETDEVLRQIPSEAIVKLQKRMAELQDSGSPAARSAVDGVLFSTRV